MQTKLNIKPAMGLKVRDPKTLAHLPEQGKEVERSSYWIRRLESGDVVEVSTPAKQLISPLAAEEILETEYKAKKPKSSKLEESKP